MNHKYNFIPLVVLDVQDAIDQPAWDNKNNPSYLANIERLMTHWRSKSSPIIHIRHDEKSSSSTYHSHGPYNGIKKEVAPIEGECVIAKQQNCAFIGTELETVLKDMQVNSFVLTGVLIHNSMDATIRVGKALGYEIIVPSDATTAVPVIGSSGKSWDAETVYELTLAILDGEYAEIITTEKLIAQL